MDIHKPKPWHGLREFLKEYAIIVLGVLTALGAEQAAEAINEAHRARAAEIRVRQEAARTMALAEERAATTPCVAAEVAKVRTFLTAADGALPDVPPLRTPPFRPSFTAEWDSALATGLHEHFDGRERAFLPTVSSEARLMRETQVRERELWQRLATLEHYPRRLDPATRESLLQTLTLAGKLNADLGGLSQQIVTNAQSAGLAPLQRDPDGSPVTHIAELRAHGCQPWP